MSKYAKPDTQLAKVEQSLNLKETDFLLKLMLKSTFEGSELMIAHSVMQKLSEIHRDKIET
tara:strand:- start:823 stop:1005 length:183 start_codon:yes stop_codon:yes gene_type:complete